MPGNIRNVDYFAAFMKRFVGCIVRLQIQHAEMESPAEFLRDIRDQFCIDHKSPRFCSFVPPKINYS